MDTTSKPLKRTGMRIAATIATGAVAGAAILAISARRSKRTIRSQLLLKVVLPTVDRAAASSTPEGHAALIARNRKAGVAPPPASLKRRFVLAEHTVDGSTVLTLCQKGAGTRKHILYLHGGAFELELLREHWAIIAGLAERLAAGITIPLYPLAPKHDYRAAHALIDAIYDDLVERVGADCLVVAGDSAGGTLTLTLGQRLRQRGNSVPAAFVLFSPWGDLTVSDPAQTEIAKRDKVLSISRARAAGKAWAGSLAPNDARINPLFASMEGLPPTLIMSGTNDILNSDAHRLMTSAKAVGADFTLSEYPGMFHVWPCAPIPEAAKALDEAADFIGLHATQW